METTRIKVDTLFDKCCKTIDGTSVPKMISTIAYVVSTEPTKLILKGLLYSLLIIL